MNYNSSIQHNITDILIEDLLEYRESPLLERVFFQAKKCLLDYLGSTLAGANISKKNADEYIQLSKSKFGSSKIIGLTNRTDIVTAILLNGISSHIAEMDDGHRFGMVHLASPIITPLLSVAEKENISGEDFLRGIILGYEAAICLASSIQPSHKNKGYHTTATCGTIGAAIGIATARKFTKDQLKTTISAAATSASGLLEIQEDGSELKPYNPAIAAVNGYLAACIGQVGFAGPEDILGGKRGFISVMSDDFRGLKRTDVGAMGILEVYFKPFASCRHCHSAIQAVLDISSNNFFNSENIKKIKVFTYDAAVNGHDHKIIHGNSSAKMSLPYSIAVAAHTGKAGIREFDLDSLVDYNAIAAMMNKVEIYSDKDLSALAPHKRVAVVQIVTNEGSVYTARVEYPRGEPENPMSQKEIEDKFLSLALYGGKTHEETYQIIQIVNNIEDDLQSIFDLL